MRGLIAFLVVLVFAIGARAGLDVPPQPMTASQLAGALGGGPEAQICRSLQVGQIVTNSTVEAAFAFDKPCVIPAGMLTLGTTIRVTQMGVYRSGLSQSITPRIRLGPAATALTGRTVLATTPAPVSGLLNASEDTPWGATTYHVVQADGSIVSAGVLLFSTSLTAALNALVATATPVTGIDPNADNVLTASAQWTAAMTANQIRATLLFVEVLRP